MKILVTGGAGFIGSNFIHYMFREHPDYEIINLDKLTYAGNLDNLKDVEDSPNYCFVKGDITDQTLVNRLISKDINVVINFAAESHVDRSIEDSNVFIKTNVLGTQVLLEAARINRVSCFIQISTDEVYGSLGAKGYFTEERPLAPNSPYSASKAGADCLVRSYFKTYGLPTIITRSSNNYGPYQFPEKFIPLIITNAVADQPIPVYGDGLNVRDWLHVEDHCRAIDLVLHEGKSGDVYNIGANNERANIEIAQLILQKLGKPRALLRYVQDRLGHDRRYAIDANKIRDELGWKPEYTFETGIGQTIQWYLENTDWWEKIKSGEYREYYERMYKNREIHAQLAQSW